MGEGGRGRRADAEGRTGGRRPEPEIGSVNDDGRPEVSSEAVFAKYLSEGLGIPSSGIDAQYLCLRYATLLCKYESLMAESGYFSENDYPPRSRSNFIPTAKDRILNVE
ncbi:hypothetical protein CQW23_01928 [Capsicum baccatum]|uniref:Uncharacterized protein n=1 Tax=Capsicum baccatum TaxID=33114 RepID=A0A2G2XPZ5_CAPBA|nr:hypothetical protein CQW23_01928 [Capsicum baccatum]